MYCMCVVKCVVVNCTKYYFQSHILHTTITINAFYFYFGIFLRCQYLNCCTKLFLCCFVLLRTCWCLIFFLLCTTTQTGINSAPLSEHIRCFKQEINTFTKCHFVGNWILSSFNLETGWSKTEMYFMKICRFCYLQLMCSRGSAVSNDLEKKERRDGGIVDYLHYLIQWKFCF